jgi:acyl carrier protein
VKEIIKKYILQEFGSDNHEFHFSYCMYPEGQCTCKRLINIDYDTPLITGGIIDSFSMVQVLVFIEKTFDVKIPDKESTPANFDSVNKITALINRHK